MLIEFSVANFRSFREKQTLSMVAATKLRKRDNLLIPNVPGESVPALLKVAAIYGPNASGKSNLVGALNSLVRMASMDAPAKSIKLPVAPFRFDADLAHEPSSFEVHFINEGRRYEFTLEATQERITRERLVEYPRGKESLLYDRTHADGRDEYEFGAKLEGGRTLHDTWRQLTGPQRLFLAQAVANSSAELTQLRTPLGWLQDGISVVPTEMDFRDLADYTQRLAKRQPGVAGDLSAFIRDVDIPVTDVRFDSPVRHANVEKSEQGSPFEGNLDELPTKATFTHTTRLGAASFSFEEESRGTQNLIGFFLPWQALTHGQGTTYSILVIDEVDASLHPQTLVEIVRRHLKNGRGAQLIFTTHDTHLMDSKLLRRDQFWLTERDENGATKLRSIYEFEGREGEDLEKRYFEGRYRGLPIIRGDT